MEHTAVAQTLRFRDFAKDKVDEMLDKAIQRYNAKEIGVRDLGAIADDAKAVIVSLKNFVHEWETA